MLVASVLISCGTLIFTLALKLPWRRLSVAPVASFVISAWAPSFGMANNSLLSDAEESSFNSTFVVV